MGRMVVTGAAGFLGSHLCRALLTQGHYVLGFDNLSTGDIANLADLRDHSGMTFTECDVAHDLPVKERVDAVLHFASPASPPRYLERPIETLEAGSIATQRALDLASRSGARFLLASTSEVYGDPLESPQRETYWGNANPVGPRSCYDEAKRFAEAMTMAYRRARDVNTGIVRIFNTYGPGLAPGDGRVISNFLAQAMGGKPLTVYGDGQQTRSYCYVDDEIRGILALLDSDIPGPVNIGNPEEYTVLEVAKLILEITGSTSAIDFEELPEDDPSQRRPDITLARELLGWEPRIALPDGLTRFQDWLRDHGL